MTVKQPNNDSDKISGRQLKNNQPKNGLSSNVVGKQISQFNY